MSCASCGSDYKNVFEIPYSFFRHIDFEIVKREGRIYQCSSCQLITSHLTNDEIESNQTLFQDKAYLQSELIEHVIYNPYTDSLESR